MGLNTETNQRHKQYVRIIRREQPITTHGRRQDVNHNKRGKVK